MPDDFRSKTLKLKRGEVRVRTSGDMTAVVSKDKRDVHRLTNIYDPSIIFNVKNLQVCFWTKMSVLVSIPTLSNGQNSALNVSYKGI
jgi:hypothetical protein